MSASRKSIPAKPRLLPARTLFMLPAAASLLAGLNAALLLLDLPAPLNTVHWGEVHGMVLALGFVGTLVALERAVALGRRAGYLSPLLLGAGSVLLLSDVPRFAGKLGLLAGMAALVWVYLPLWRRQRDHAVLIQLLGAALGTGAAILWLGGVDMALLLPWLVAFLVLSIAGERVELARICMGPLAGTRALQLSWLLTFAVVASLLNPAWGSIGFGLVLAALALWLAAHDVARRTIRATGATRFMASCMLAGYGWLLVAAITWCFGLPGTRAAYDTVIHAVFLGFTISMVIAHSSSILPAILRRPLPYRPMMWAPAILLWAGLLLRLWIGNGLGYDWAWRAGGVANVLALLLFLALAVASVLIGEPRPKPAAPVPPAADRPGSGTSLLAPKPPGIGPADGARPMPGTNPAARPPRSGLSISLREPEE
ncbi:hypothetical protein DQ353_13640 [Arthrobacter sp. AQ5-05]|uniref:hypothetical protein n=1 Tax=Arthrobacter sp. AQ5-05 TaxID=2184581 RepID=UPI000DCDAAFD|nr:hypothetical protein [Arthrobacter sp. AQ5-05]RAX48764.1 hypothetical protein DQ353_13640 [Arthrobacter sp. AQ5-05]